MAVFRLKFYDYYCSKPKRRALEHSKRTKVMRTATPVSKICGSAVPKFKAAILEVVTMPKLDVTDINR